MMLAEFRASQISPTRSDGELYSHNYEQRELSTPGGYVSDSNNGSDTENSEERLVGWREETAIDVRCVDNCTCCYAHYYIRLPVFIYHSLT